MFGYNDKTTLTGTNTLNKKGKLIDYIISFPSEDIDSSLPDDIIQMSIIEGHLGYENYGYTAFKICVGELTSLSEIGERKERNIQFYRSALDCVKNTDDKLCYYVDSEGKKIVFAKINEGDIVVKDSHELKMILIAISNNFESIQNAISNIKSVNDRVDYSLTAEDIALSKKRVKKVIEARKNGKE